MHMYWTYSWRTNHIMAFNFDDKFPPIRFWAMTSYCFAVGCGSIFLEKRCFWENDVIPFLEFKKLFVMRGRFYWKNRFLGISSSSHSWLKKCCICFLPSANVKQCLSGKEKPKTKQGKASNKFISWTPTILGEVEFKWFLSQPSLKRTNMQGSYAVLFRV